MIREKPVHIKLIYLLLLVPFLSVSSYAQETQEEKRWTETLQTADTSSLISFMEQFEPWEPRKTPTLETPNINIHENDTAREANTVMRTVLKAYKEDLLKGSGRYKDITQWPRLIVIQPEVKVCFVSTPEIDYRTIFSGKYIYYDMFTYDDWLDAHQTGSRLDRFPPCYNEIPDISGCKTYRYYRRSIDSQFITLDTLTQIRLEKYFLNKVDLLDRKKSMQSSQSGSAK